MLGMKKHLKDTENMFKHLIGDFGHIRPLPATIYIYVKIPKNRKNHDFSNFEYVLRGGLKHQNWTKISPLDPPKASETIY